MVLRELRVILQQGTEDERPGPPGSGDPVLRAYPSQPPPEARPRRTRRYRGRESSESEVVRRPPEIDGSRVAIAGRAGASSSAVSRQGGSTGAAGTGGEGPTRTASTSSITRASSASRGLTAGSGSTPAPGRASGGVTRLGSGTAGARMLEAPSNSGRRTVGVRHAGRHDAREILEVRLGRRAQIPSHAEPVEGPAEGDPRDAEAPVAARRPASPPRGFPPRPASTGVLRGLRGRDTARGPVVPPSHRWAASTPTNSVGSSPGSSLHRTSWASYLPTRNVRPVRALKGWFTPSRWVQGYSSFRGSGSGFSPTESPSPKAEVMLSRDPPGS